MKPSQSQTGISQSQTGSSQPQTGSGQSHSIFRQSQTGFWDSQTGSEILKLDPGFSNWIWDSQTGFSQTEPGNVTLLELSANCSRLLGLDPAFFLEGRIGIVVLWRNESG